MRLLLVPLALVAMVLAGCSRTIDAEKVESIITKEVEAKAGKVKSVKCPEGRKAKKGDTFRCTITGTDGSTAKATVLQRDNKGNVRSRSRLVFNGRIEQLLSTRISQQVGAKVRVTCPEIVELRKGNTFTCEGSSGGKTRKVVVKQPDDQGNVTYRLLP